MIRVLFSIQTMTVGLQDVYVDCPNMEVASALIFYVSAMQFNGPTPVGGNAPLLIKATNIKTQEI